MYVTGFATPTRPTTMSSEEAEILNSLSEEEREEIIRHAQRNSIVAFAHS